MQPLFAAGGPIDAAAAVQHVLSHHPPCPCALGVAAGLRLGKLGSASDGAALSSFTAAQQDGLAAVDQGGLVEDSPRAAAAAAPEQDQHDTDGEETRLAAVECCVLGTWYIAGMLLWGLVLHAAKGGRGCTVPYGSMVCEVGRLWCRPGALGGLVCDRAKHKC